MPTSEPLHVAFVWHMHQPYYRSARTGAFELPWVRLHAIKDYLDMVEILTDYPDVHQTFNLVPCLVEQLEDYASLSFIDVYWEHTLKPAQELEPAERAFLVERMCERSDHPRARSHPRYLELAQKREAHASLGWDACARAFSSDELRDLQVLFNLTWFDPEALASDPLRDLIERSGNFLEEDKQIIAHVQAELLVRTLPSYRESADRGQVELSTSPYFHPILPLLINSDSARISAPDTVLPPTRFAHPEDAAEQVESALVKHQRIFGGRPRGMWCSEQAVGEDVVQLLMEAGLAWTISDETVLARSLSGAATRGHTPVDRTNSGATSSPGSLYFPYRLERDAGEMAMVFRDHTLSDLIGFAYRSWDSRDAAADLLRRLRDLRIALMAAPTRPAAAGSYPLVTIALDGENAWEYYPRDGRDFLRYLYEGFTADSSFRCVTISEHLHESPPVRSLDWLHTGSWIGGDLRTWSGDRAHSAAWDLLHQARDLAAAHRGSATRAVRSLARPAGLVDEATRAIPLGDDVETDPQIMVAWRHVLVAEGSDWFWWFGEHHHTELDRVWDLGFRLHLQEVYRSLGEPVPVELFLPLLDETIAAQPALPQRMLAPTIDGLIESTDEWEGAGYLAADLPSTMQRAEGTKIIEVRFGWDSNRLCLLVVPGISSDLGGLGIRIHVTRPGQEDDPVVHLTLEDGGQVEVSCMRGACDAETVEAVWDDVLEVSLPFAPPMAAGTSRSGLVVQIGRGGLTEHVFHSVGLASIGWGEQ